MIPLPSKASLLALFTSLVTFFVFFPASNYGFGNFDTPYYILENSHVNTGLSLENLYWAFTTNYMANWHPLTWLSHMADVQFFSLDSGAHHLVNIALHAINVQLLFFSLCHVTKTTTPSAIVSLLFAIHPTQVESVVWIAERKDVLFTFFMLTGIIFYCRYVEQKKKVALLISFICFVFGGMSKPMIITFPFVLLLLDYWPLHRISKDELLSARLWPLVFEKIPFFTVAAMLGYITYRAQGDAGAMTGGLHFSFTNKLSNAVVGYSFYIEKALIPSELAAYYPHPEIWPTKVLIKSSIVLLSALGVMIFSFFRAPLVFFGLALFFGTLVPVIGLVQVGSQAFADRYSYVPNIGLFIASVFPLYRVYLHYVGIKIYINIACSALGIILILAASQQVKVWRDEVTLWGNTLMIVDDSYPSFLGLTSVKPTESYKSRPAALTVPYFMTGYALSKRGNYAEAIRHFNVAIEVHPLDAYAPHHKGLAQHYMGQNNLAIESLLAHEKLSPKEDTRTFVRKALYNLGFLRIPPSPAGKPILICNHKPM